VIHSWWVPALGGKIDAIPGQTNRTWFQAKKAGHYEVRCAELCGLEHAHMTGWVDVVTPAQYTAFLAARTAGNEPLGHEIFEGVCAPCTGWRARATGPKIKAARSSATRRCSPTPSHGKNKMPPVGATWDDATMKAATDCLGRSTSVAVDAARPYRADWKRGRVTAG
jgi:hypothetical protein